MKHLFALLSLCFSLTAGAQNVYDEAVETPSDAECAAMKTLKSDLRFTWTDADVSLQRFALPLDDRTPRTDTVITAWRGERVGLRGVFCTSRAEQKAVLELRPANAAAKTAGSTYTVKQGDTISAIAARNGVSTKELLAANGLSAQDASKIRPGRHLTIPGKAAAPAPKKSSAKSSAKKTTAKKSTKKGKR